MYLLQKRWKWLKPWHIGGSYDRAEQELLNEYQHDWVWIVIKHFCILVPRSKVASASKGLRYLPKYSLFKNTLVNYSWCFLEDTGMDGLVNNIVRKWDFLRMLYDDYKVNILFISLKYAGWKWSFCRFYQFVQSSLVLSSWSWDSAIVTPRTFSLYDFSIFLLSTLIFSVLSEFFLFCLLNRSIDLVLVLFINILFLVHHFVTFFESWFKFVSNLICFNTSSSGIIWINRKPYCKGAHRNHPAPHNPAPRNTTPHNTTS